MFFPWLIRRQPIFREGMHLVFIERLHDDPWTAGEVRTLFMELAHNPSRPIRDCHDDDSHFMGRMAEPSLATVDSKLTVFADLHLHDLAAKLVREGKFIGVSPEVRLNRTTLHTLAMVPAGCVPCLGLDVPLDNPVRRPRTFSEQTASPGWVVMKTPFGDVPVLDHDADLLAYRRAAEHWQFTEA